ncbi:MAG: TniQ family protein [Gammaproteobacteria bacterium]
MLGLLPLTMLGTGTREIEAFPSYLVRLASSHGITTGRLLRLMLTDGKDSSIGLAAAIQSQPFAGLVRPNATTLGVLQCTSRHVIESLETLTHGTFVHLLPALKRSANTYVCTVRWCPACLGEQENDQGSAYLKLSWFLQEVETCAIHRIRLRDQCPSCQRIARPLNRWTTFTACQHCETRLDRVSADDVVKINPQATAPDLIKLIADLAHRVAPFPTRGVNRYVDQVFSEAWASQREQELWKRLPRDDCLRYASAEEPVTLAAARRIAYLLEVPISELLEGDLPSIQSFGFPD